METVDELRERAALAVSLLENSLFRGILSAMDEHTVRSWREAKTPEEREEMHMKQALLAEMRHDLFRMVETAAKQETINNEQGPFRAFIARFRGQRPYVA